MGVNVEGDPRIGVPEPFAYHLRVLPGGQKQGCCGMPQVVQADHRHLGSLNERKERLPADIASPEVSASGVAEHRPGNVSFGQHPPAMLFEGGQGESGEVDPPPAALRLRLFEPESAVDFFEGTPHNYLPALEINIWPLKSKQFAKSHP